MQLDMHYHATYCMARTAGLTIEAARIIATAAQFVDDNAQKDEANFTDASQCRVEATAHHALNIENIDPDDQRKVWVPFHFLPGNKGKRFTKKLVCHKDSKIAREMVENHLSQKDKDYYLELIGVMAHVYADTFAHYGFSGVSSRHNKVINNSFEFDSKLTPEMKKYITDKKDSFFSRFTSLIRNIKSTAAENLSGALGHGAVVTFPDRPYLKWRFDYERKDKSKRDSGWRDNPKTYLEYCKKIHAIFVRVAKNNSAFQDKSAYREWSDLAPRVNKILRAQGTKAERIKAWKRATKRKKLFNVSEDIPEYTDWNEGFDQLDGAKSGASEI